MRRYNHWSERQGSARQPAEIYLENCHTKPPSLSYKLRNQLFYESLVNYRAIEKSLAFVSVPRLTRRKFCTAPPSFIVLPLFKSPEFSNLYDLRDRSIPYEQQPHHKGTSGNTAANVDWGKGVSSTPMRVAKNFTTVHIIRLAVWITRIAACR